MPSGRPLDFLRYRSLAGLATALTWLLGASIVSALALAVACGYRMSKVNAFDDNRTLSALSDVDDADDLVSAMASILGIITLAIFVVFIVFLYRASKNTELWNIMSRTWTPGLDDRRLVHPTRELRHSRARGQRYLETDTGSPDERRERPGNFHRHHLGLVGAVRDRLHREPARSRPRHTERRSHARLDQHRRVDRAGGVGGAAHHHRPHHRPTTATDRVPVDATGLTDSAACDARGYHRIGAGAVPASGDVRSPPPRAVSGRAATRSEIGSCAATPTGCCSRSC